MQWEMVKYYISNEPQGQKNWFCSPCASTQGPVAELECAQWQATALETQGLGAQTKGNRWIQQTARGGSRYQWGDYEQHGKQLSLRTSCLATRQLTPKKGKKEKKPLMTDPPPWASLAKNWRCCIIVFWLLMSFSTPTHLPVDAVPSSVISSI